jgi:NitT/TauT family transport system ATP-binding protein
MSMAAINAPSFSAMSPLVRIESLHKAFHRGKETVEAVAGIDLTIERGEIVALIGPSGCGKSTLLHMIAGLYAPSAGNVLYGDRVVTDVNTAVAYMTQKDNLLPWRTVRDNVAFPLELAGVSVTERNRRAEEVLAKVGLSGFEQRFSAELSGGMRKRACLARMLLQGAECLLLDEPFGALDAQLKMSMHDLLLRLAAEGKQTVVFVTHDLMEAVTLADRVVVCTRRPATIALQKPIHLSRPRDVVNVRFEPEFKALYDSIWDRLREEYSEDHL